MRKCRGGGAGGRRKSGGYDGTMAANQEDEAKLTALLLLLKYHYSTIRRPISHDNGAEAEGPRTMEWRRGASPPHGQQHPPTVQHRHTTTPTLKVYTLHIIADTVRSLSSPQQSDRLLVSPSEVCCDDCRIISTSLLCKCNLNRNRIRRHFTPWIIRIRLNIPPVLRVF